MRNDDIYKISVLGEFADRSLEKEFLSYDMKRNAKFIGPLTLTFGFLYMLYIIFDYDGIARPSLFVISLTLRLSVIVLSAALYFHIRKAKNYGSLVYLLSLFEVVTVLSFFVILYLYDDINYIAFFSVITITLAIFVIPNRLIYSFTISAVMILFFYLFTSRLISGLKIMELIKVMAYNILIMAFCTISTFTTHYYKRRQFADSRELQKMSVTDPLTGIFNRLKFNEELVRWINFSNRYGNPVSLVIFDIDDFKKINDSYGHMAGDAVLKKVAVIVNNAIRNTDVFARWGGEEFVILLPNTDLEQAWDVTERIRRNIERGSFCEEYGITCSFGLVQKRKDESGDSLIIRADKLMYNAKDRGKNTIVTQIN